MKKHVFKEGYLDYICTKLPSKYMKKLEDSKFNIEATYPEYDVARYLDTNYFMIFKARGANCNYISEEKATNNFTKFLNDNTVSDDILVLGSLDRNPDNTIIWDTFSDTIYVKGMRNTRLMIMELYLESFTRLSEKRTEEMEQRHLLAAEDCELIRKTLLNPDWCHEEAETEERKHTVRKK